MIKRYSKRNSVLGLMLHALITYMIYVLPYFRGLYSFVGESLIIASISCLSALHGFGIGALASLISPIPSLVVLNTSPLDINMILQRILQPFVKYVVVAGFVGILVDTPEKIGRIALWTYLSLIIQSLVTASILGNPDYYLNTFLPQSSLEYISASLITLELVFPYSFLAKILEKTLRGARKASSRPKSPSK